MDEREYYVSVGLIRDGKMIADGVVGITMDGRKGMNEIGEAALVVDYAWRLVDFHPEAFTTGAGDTYVPVEEGDEVVVLGVEMSDLDKRKLRGAL